MVPKYSSFRITEGIEKFYDFFKTYSERDYHLPGGWEIRLDEWYDPNITGSTIRYIVFSGVYDEIKFDVHFAFKQNFCEAFVGNVCPTNRSQLSPNDYNQCLDKFANEVVNWYDKINADGEFRYEYTAILSTPIKPLEASASKVPAGKIVFSINDGEAGVSVELYAVVSADIDVAKIIERFDPSNEESVLTTAKMYDSADIILDTSKTDAFRVVDSDKSAIDLLSEPGVINGFTFMGSTYISGNCGIGYRSKAVVMADRIELMLG